MTFVIPNYVLVMHAGVVGLPDLLWDSSRLALDGRHGAGRNKTTAGVTYKRGIPISWNEVSMLGSSLQVCDTFDPKY